jgi:hypothetical protein
MTVGKLHDDDQALILADLEPEAVDFALPAILVDLRGRAS